jgi:hypothetical protein
MNDEEKKAYRRAIVCIGETLVEESKLHITSEQACSRIREYLSRLDYELYKAGEHHE